MAGIRPIHSREFEKFLKMVGCVEVRQRGDHAMYNRSGIRRPVVICKGRNLSVVEIMSNLRTLGINPKDYLEMIQKI